MSSKKNKQKLSLDRETWMLLLVIGGGVLATFGGVMFNLTMSPPPGLPQTSATQVSLANVPLATGDEPLDRLFKQSGCIVCHTIPGVKNAKGREGPKLVLGATGLQRLADPKYTGTATTVREYIVESILSPGAFVVAGYPDRVMPEWYGQKLSAKALDKIADHLEGLTETTN